MKTVLNLITRMTGRCLLFATALLAPAGLHAQWNTNTSENLLISGLPTADIQSAPTTDGKTWIAFYHENGGNYDMRAQLIDANGYKLLGPDGVVVDNKPSGTATYVFNVCVDLDNNFIIGCQDQRTGNMQAVVYKVSQSGTPLWVADGLVLGGGLAPYPAALSTGEVIVTWNADAGNTLNLQKITTSGTTAWAVPIVVKVGTASTTRGQLVGNNDGKFTMVYQKGSIYTTFYAQMFSNSGTALYAPLQICNQTTASYRYYSVLAEGDTTYVGYYSSQGNRFNSFLQRVNPDGTIPYGINGSNFNTSVAAGNPYQGETRIGMLPGSNFVWSVCTFSNPNQTVYGVYIQKFVKTTGARLFTDQAKVVYPISAATDQQCGNLAVVTGDNPMFTSYDVTEKIYATRLDGDGNFAWPGNRVELSSTTAPAGTPKMRYGLTPDGPDRLACNWTENRGGGYMGYAQGISVGGLIGLKVATQGGVPANISSAGGTLQMTATVFPSSANQSVTWSIVPGTGMATISATGLVTAVANGNVYAKAAAVQDPTMKDSLLIAISGQSTLPPDVVTLAATAVAAHTATLNGTVNANGLSSDVSFEWGLTAAYGNTAAAVPATVTGNSVTPVLASLSGLTSSTTYHFRAKAVSPGGTSYGADLTFTTDAGVGINNRSATVAEVRPVPNNGSFTLTWRGSHASFDLDLFNATGALVRTLKGLVPDASGAATVNLRPLAAGIYTVVLRSGEERGVCRVVVE